MKLSDELYDKVDELVQDWLNHADVEEVYAYAEEQSIDWYLKHPDAILESYEDLMKRRGENDEAPK